MKTSVFNLDQFLKWFWKYKAAFPTIYLLLRAGLTVGISTAPCAKAQPGGAQGAQAPP